MTWDPTEPYTCLLSSFSNICRLTWVWLSALQPQASPRIVSRLTSDAFHTDDVNPSRIQASLLNGYSTPLLV